MSRHCVRFKYLFIISRHCVDIVPRVTSTLSKESHFYLIPGCRMRLSAQLVKWTKLVLPKSRGGWGIKNPDLFCKALGEKSLWRMVENPDSLWGRTMRVKYCPHSSIEECFRKPVKTHEGGSTCWKEFVVSFPLVGNWVA